jgi:hypothetical protein
MSVATLRTRLTRLEHHPHLARRAWAIFYCGQFLGWIEQAARQVGLPLERQQWFVQAVQDAWPLLAPQCPTATTPGDVAAHQMYARLWAMVDSILARQFDAATRARLEDALVAVSNAP